MRKEDGTFAKLPPNEVEMFEDYAILWTTDKQGNRRNGYKIDLDDVEILSQYRWSVDTDGYAKHRTRKMHRVIMGAKKVKSLTISIKTKQITEKVICASYRIQKT